MSVYAFRECRAIEVIHIGVRLLFGSCSVCKNTQIYQDMQIYCPLYVISACERLRIWNRFYTELCSESFVFIPRKITKFNLNFKILNEKFSVIRKNNTFKLFCCVFFSLSATDFSWFYVYFFAKMFFV